jgi:hypothetical protein
MRGKGILEYRAMESHQIFVSFIVNIYSPHILRRILVIHRTRQPLAGWFMRQGEPWAVRQASEFDD